MQFAGIDCKIATEKQQEHLDGYIEKLMNLLFS